MESAAETTSLDDELLTAREGFLALSDFLWRRTRAEVENLFTLVGDTALRDDGASADPAAWADWLDSVARIRRGCAPRDPAEGALAIGR